MTLQGGSHRGSYVAVDEEYLQHSGLRGCRGCCLCSVLVMLLLVALLNAAVCSSFKPESITRRQNCRLVQIEKNCRQKFKVHLALVFTCMQY